MSCLKLKKFLLSFAFGKENKMDDEIPNDNVTLRMDSNILSKNVYLLSKTNTTLNSSESFGSENVIPSSEECSFSESPPKELGI